MHHRACFHGMGKQIPPNLDTDLSTDNAFRLVLLPTVHFALWQ